MKNYRVLVTIDPVVPVEELHQLDADEVKVGSTIYRVEAENEEEAKEAALDEYHFSNPIKVLDDFDITVDVELEK